MRIRQILPKGFNSSEKGKRDEVKSLRRVGCASWGVPKCNYVFSVNVRETFDSETSGWLCDAQLWTQAWAHVSPKAGAQLKKEVSELLAVIDFEKTKYIKFPLHLEGDKFAFVKMIFI